MMLVDSSQTKLLKMVAHAMKKAKKIRKELLLDKILDLTIELLI
jgi:hypothetical protein